MLDSLAPRGCLFLRDYFRERVVDLVACLISHSMALDWMQITLLQVLFYAHHPCMHIHHIWQVI